LLLILNTSFLFLFFLNCAYTEEQLAKLEELFREGFIIEEDYRARKAELTMQGQRQTTDRSEGQSSCSRQGPPSTPPHEAAGDYDELLSAEDEDDSEEDFYWEVKQKIPFFFSPRL